MPTMLTGDLGSGAEFMLNNDFEPLAAKKFQNFLEFQALYPEFSFVFVCDNGQGDVRAAEMMIAACPDKVEAVYVHLVVPLERTHGYRDAQTPARWDAMGIYFGAHVARRAVHAATAAPPPRYRATPPPPAPPPPAPPTPPSAAGGGASRRRGGRRRRGRRRGRRGRGGDAAAAPPPPPPVANKRARGARPLIRPAGVRHRRGGRARLHVRREVGRAAQREARRRELNRAIRAANDSCARSTTRQRGASASAARRRRARAAARRRRLAAARAVFGARRVGRERRRRAARGARGRARAVRRARRGACAVRVPGRLALPRRARRFRGRRRGLPAGRRHVHRAARGALADENCAVAFAQGAQLSSPSAAGAGAARRERLASGDARARARRRERRARRRRRRALDRELGRELDPRRKLGLFKSGGGSGRSASSVNSEDDSSASGASAHAPQPRRQRRLDDEHRASLEPAMTEPLNE